MRRIGDHVVVLGASIGGLLAARVLAEAYDRVTVIDRDDLPAAGGHRRGVPQDRHIHGLLPSGARVFEELFPGLLADLATGGSPVISDFSQARAEFGGHRLCSMAVPVPGTLIQCSRPYFEDLVRARVRALPAVHVIGGCEAIEPVTAAGTGRVARVRVTGVRVHRRQSGDVTTLAADLVVDAMGRGGRASTWLAALGYRRPVEERVTVDVKYASRPLRLRPGALEGTRQVLVGAHAGRPRGMGMFAVEGDRWMLSVFGYHGHHPPTDPQGFLDFAGTVAPPDVFAEIRAAQPLADVAAYRFPASVRRRYERLRRLPAGLLAFGDATCSLSPVYGQGMSVAALQAVALRDALAKGDRDLGRRFLRAAARPLDAAWKLATGADLALPQVEGARPLPVRIINAYVARFLTAAEHDAVLVQRFFRIAGLLDPPTRMFRPSTLGRVLAGSLRNPDAAATRPPRDTAPQMRDAVPPTPAAAPRPAGLTRRS